MKAIAKRLNAEAAVSPRAQQGRPQCWAPSSVREVLHRELYRGISTWNRTKKRDSWGQRQKSQAPRSANEWIQVPSPNLRIISDETWQQARARLATVRSLYLGATNGRAFGRPAIGGPSRYLLTNLALCGCCGGPLPVRSRKHTDGRRHFYGCASYHEHGRTVCTNRHDVPMEDADAVVLEALLDDVLDAEILSAAVDRALQLVTGDQTTSRLPAIDAEIERVT